MIKIIKTADNMLSKQHGEWRNSRTAALNMAQGVTQNNSNMSDEEIDQISDQLDSVNCPTARRIENVKQLEIDQYVNNFVKQNGSIIDNNTSTKKSSSKVLLG